MISIPPVLQMKNNLRGQSMVEYLLLLAAVIVVVYLILQPGGIVNQTIERPFEKATRALDRMARCTCYDLDGVDCPALCGNRCCEPAGGENAFTCIRDCPPVCGNRICEPTETRTNCPADC